MTPRFAQACGSRSAQDARAADTALTAVLIRSATAAGWENIAAETGGLAVPR